MSSRLSRWGQGDVIRYLLFFTYLTFLGGTVYTDMSLVLRVAHQLVMSVVLGVWLIGLVRRGEGWPWTGLELPLFVFMAVRLASSLVGTDPRMSVEMYWRPFTHLLLLYWLVWLLRGNKRRQVIRAYFLVMGVVCIVGMTEFIGWYLGLSFLPVFQEGWLQIGGLSNPIPPSSWRLNFTLTNATSLSTFLSLLIPPAIMMALRTRRHDVRIGWVLLVSLAVIVQVLTRSRGGLLGLGVAAAVGVSAYSILCRGHMLTLWRRLTQSKPFWLACGLSATVGLASAIALLPGYIGRRTTLDIRVEMWKCAIEEVVAHPLLGVGMGNYGRSLRHCLEISTDKFEHFTTAHNLYLHIAAESGLVGVAALGFLMGALAWRVRERWHSSQLLFDRIEVIIITATLVGFGVNCLFDTLTSTPLVLPVVFLVAWLIGPLRGGVTSARWSQSLSALMIFVLAVYLAGLLWINSGQWQFEKGMAAAGRGDYGTAAELVLRAKQRDPFLDLYTFQHAFYLGQLASRDSDRFLAPAIVGQEDSVRLDGSYSVHLANLAALYWQNAEGDKAMATMGLAFEKNPPDAALWLNYGLMNEQLGRRGAALDAYAQALAGRPQWADSGFWAETEFRSQSYGEILVRAAERSETPFNLWFAADELEQATASIGGPRTGIEFQQRGQVHFRMGALEEAQADLTRALELCPRCVGAYIDRSRLYWELGFLEDAEMDAGTAIFVGSYRGAQAYQTLAWIALGEGDIETAIDLLWRAVPPQIDDYNWEAVLFNRRGDIGLLPQLVQIEGGAHTFAPWLELAELYMALDRPDEARQVYELVLVRDPFVPGVEAKLAAIKGD
jgi:putative inorganic carbon (hco3(-)) transporter